MTTALTFDDRLALIGADPHGRLEVRPWPSQKGAYEIAPRAAYAQAMGSHVVVRLTFTDRDGAPRVLDIKNHSDVSGWGTHMVLALRRGYPGVERWHSTGVQETGIKFWAKVRERHKIALVGFEGQEGHRLERLEEKRAEYSRAGRAAERKHTLEDLDALVATPPSRGMKAWWAQVRGASGRASRSR